MNTLTAPRPAVPGPARAVTPRQHRRRRRWLRAVLPFAVVLLLIAVSAIAFHVVNGSPGDADYLSPGSTADHGAARLATLLTAKGTAVERVAHSSDALVSAYRGDATLFLPTPSLMHPFYLRMLKLLPSSTTVVLVAPNSRELADGHLPVGVADQELATFPASPQCADPVAAKAGSADLDRVHYTRPDGPFQTALYRCYSGALVGVRWHDTELTLVGAADPFRNDRIDEVGNARLATGLLTRRSRMIWLDLHEAEPPPRLITDPNATAGAGAPASLGPGSPDPDFPIAGTAGPGDRPHRPRGGGTGQGGLPPDPLWSAFPAWVWATVVLLLAATLMLAFARGRRLGAPVGEPLPVAVPAAETVRGRGRLYRRAKARAPALATLRAAARDRLTRLLDAAPDTSDEELARMVAVRTGLSVDDVLATLSASVESDDNAEADAELVRCATALDALVHAVARGPGQPDDARTDEGESR